VSGGGCVAWVCPRGQCKSRRPKRLAVLFTAADAQRKSAQVAGRRRLPRFQMLKRGETRCKGGPVCAGGGRRGERVSFFDGDTTA
jgi:hypothetical protein